MAHFWSIDAGQIGVIFMIVLLFLRLDRFQIEHDMLMQDYAERHDMKLDELPTRRKPGWAFWK